MITLHLEMEKLQEIYLKAREFTKATHNSDLEYLQHTNKVIDNFEQFYEEYCYCVVASGFRGAVAAKLAHQLAACNGDYDECIKIFKNQVKVRAICKCYEKLSETYPEVKDTWKRPEDLTQLPYIGNITCYHLARNIGIQSCVKPDLHLMRLIENLFGGKKSEKEVQRIISELAKENNVEPGIADFCLWVYLSHNQGQRKPCCDGGLRLR